jgi:rhodanese-related sulfurtransferase
MYLTKIIKITVQTKGGGQRHTGIMCLTKITAITVQTRKSCKKSLPLQLPIQPKTTTMQLQKILILLLILAAPLTVLLAQKRPANRQGHCENAQFDKKVASMLKFSVPAIDVKTLKDYPQPYLLLDAREPEEYQVSHLPQAQNCGYQDFDLKKWEKLDKKQPVIVYCSIGYRSEKIAEKLKAAGFTQVMNLYGSIFEWVNRGYPLAGAEPGKVHTYNKEWGKLVEEGKVRRVW